MIIIFHLVSKWPLGTINNSTLAPVSMLSFHLYLLLPYIHVHTFETLKFILVSYNGSLKSFRECLWSSTCYEHKWSTVYLALNNNSMKYKHIRSEIFCYIYQIDFIKIIRPLAYQMENNDHLLTQSWLYQFKKIYLMIVILKILKML
jgi:hypothetical protein